MKTFSKLHDHLFAPIDQLSPQWARLSCRAVAPHSVLDPIQEQSRDHLLTSSVPGQINVTRSTSHYPAHLSTVRRAWLRCCQDLVSWFYDIMGINRSFKVMLEEVRHMFIEAALGEGFGWCPPKNIGQVDKSCDRRTRANPLLADGVGPLRARQGLLKRRRSPIIDLCTLHPHHRACGVWYTSITSIQIFTARPAVDGIILASKAVYLAFLVEPSRHMRLRMGRLLKTRGISSFHQTEAGFRETGSVAISRSGLAPQP